MSVFNKLPFLNREKEELSQAEKSRKIIINLVFRVVILFMLAVAVIYGLFSVVSGSSIFIPGDAKGVLEKVDQKNSYAWNVQIARKARFPGFDRSDPIVEQNRLTGAVLNRERNTFQAGVRGVFPLEALYNSDGKYTLQLIGGGDEFQIITDVCSGAPAISVKTVEMPGAELIEQSDPTLETDEETFFGERAWGLKIKKPVPQLLEKLFWIDFLDQVSVNPSLKDWVLSDQERSLIKRGEYELERSKILITYKSPYQIAKIDMNIKIGYSRYRILAQSVPTTGGELLEEKDFGKPDC